MSTWRWGALTRAVVASASRKLSSTNRFALALLVVVAMLTGSCERPAAERPSLDQVRELVAHASGAAGEDSVYAIDEFEVRDWYDVQPGLVRVRVYVKAVIRDPDSKAGRLVGGLGEVFGALSGQSLTDGVEREYDLERWDSGWKLRPVE